MKAGLVLASGLLAACGGGDAYVVITVETRPAVVGATALRVTLTNGGATLTNDLPLAGHAFPVTFSVSSPAATGGLVVDISALDANQLLVGHGVVTADLATAAASVTLDTADFVVNTEFPMDQYLSDDFEATGTQLAATGDGTWIAGFRDDCNTACNLYARRFGATGQPVDTVVGAGANQFNITTVLTNFLSTPTAAAAMTKTVLLWDSHDNTTAPATDGISCRPLDATGTAAAAETLVAAELGTDVVAAVGLANGNFAVSWNSENATTSTLQVRGVIIKPDCSPVGAPITLSPTTGTVPAHRAHVGTSGNTLLYAWISGGDVHVRGATTSNVTTTADTILVAHASTLDAQHVRVVPLGAAGYAVIVRWYSDFDESVPGKIEMYRVSTAGAAMGGPTLVTDKSGSDFASQFAASVATRADGAILVTWHGCAANGDGQGCGVFGRVLRPSGAPVGDAFPIPTTTLGNQANPSTLALADSFVVAWNDASALAPDISGLAVRARIIYPPFDDAKSISGATCGAGLPPCNDGLVCAPGTDGSRCYAACDGTNICPAGGTCTSGGCAF